MTTKLLAILMCVLLLTSCGGSAGTASSPAVSSSTSIASSDVAAGDSYRPKEGDDAYYQKVVADKAVIQEAVAGIVAFYKQGTPPNNPNHYPEYPESFPPAEQLWEIEKSDDFAVRFAGNPDALGSVYIAVPVGTDGQYEMHVCVSEYYDEKTSATVWGTTDVFFEKVSDLKWHTQDVDLYTK